MLRVVQLCIKINNVETVVKQLAGLRKDLHNHLQTKEDRAELTRIFGGIFSAVNLRYNQIIVIITSHVHFYSYYIPVLFYFYFVVILLLLLLLLLF